MSVRRGLSSSAHSTLGLGFPRTFTFKVKSPSSDKTKGCKELSSINSGGKVSSAGTVGFPLKSSTLKDLSTVLLFMIATHLYMARSLAVGFLITKTCEFPLFCTSTFPFGLNSFPSLNHSTFVGFSVILTRRMTSPSDVTSNGTCVCSSGTLRVAISCDRSRSI